jgi:hypothetical protein
MKSLVIGLVLFLGLAGDSNSQALIGFTMSEVKSKYPDTEWTYNHWGKNDALQTMSFETDKIGVIYFFDENYRSIITAIVPKTQGTLQGMIELYNSKYVIIDESHWKFYANGVVMNCSLQMTEGGAYYFNWTD